MAHHPENSAPQSEDHSPPPQERARLRKDILIGSIAFGLLMLALLLVPQHVAGVFTAMSKKAFENVFGIYILGYIGASIIVAVALGRLLERIGMTDALVKLFAPISKLLRINPTFMIPGIYNFLGDVNAAGRITAPIMQKAGATRDEKCIAIATMMQFPPAFGSFLLGLTCLATGGINAFAALVISVFMPLVLCPLILKLTVYRNCGYRKVEEIPPFTPHITYMDTIFGGVMEGADVLFRIIVPTTCAIFAGIALLEYFHIWFYVEYAISFVLELCKVEPTTGLFSILASGAVSLPQFHELMLSGTTFDAGTVLSTFMLGTASMQLVLPLSNIPIIWSKETDLSYGEVLVSALLGVALRLIWCAVAGWILAPVFFG